MQEESVPLGFLYLPLYDGHISLGCASCTVSIPCTPHALSGLFGPTRYSPSPEKIPTPRPDSKTAEFPYLQCQRKGARPTRLTVSPHPLRLDHTNMPHAAHQQADEMWMQAVAPCVLAAYGSPLLLGPRIPCRRQPSTAYDKSLFRVDGQILPALTDDDASANRTRIAAELF